MESSPHVFCIARADNESRWAMFLGTSGSTGLFCECEMNGFARKTAQTQRPAGEPAFGQMPVSEMTFLQIAIPLWFLLSMILSENRFPLFRIIL
jgi:hypothetical protein